MICFQVLIKAKRLTLPSFLAQETVFYTYLVLRMDLIVRYKEAGGQIYMYARDPNPDCFLSNRDIQQGRLGGDKGTIRSDA